jgi:hypothetical protein
MTRSFATPDPRAASRFAPPHLSCFAAATFQAIFVCPSWQQLYAAAFVFPRFGVRQPRALRSGNRASNRLLIYDRSVITSLSNLMEAIAFSAFVSLYIWRWQEASPRTWLVFPVWLLLSFALHRDTPRTIGWRADNLQSATRRAAPIFLLFFIALGLAGIALGALHRAPVHFIAPKRFVGYFAFCLLQQIGLQSLTMNRLLKGLRSPEAAAFVGGVLFAALHLPNPVLVPLTFVGGTIMCRLFARERNILPLVLGQAILGGLVWWAFPLAWHHSMRVGPGYYTYLAK